eukprot:403361571
MSVEFKKLMFANKVQNRYGQYELIQSKIGIGSLGEVHLVKRNNIEYAMKIVQFDMDDEEQQYDLLNEVHIIKHLDSKYLCKSVDCFVNTYDEFCMVFPYAKNGDLLSYIEKNMPGQDIPEETLKDWIAQIALGLLELHSSNIMHRDIKPSNILVLDDGSLQIFDFGMAAKSGERPKRKRSFAGTYDYMAPELANLKYDNQADIYSLGILILELANRKHSKRMPYTDKFESYAPNFSYQFNDLIWKMLNENSQTRPNSFQLVCLDYLSQSKFIKEYFNTKGSIDYAQGMINQCLQIVSFHISTQQRDSHNYLYMHELDSLIKSVDKLKSKMNNYQFLAKAYWDEYFPEYDSRLIQKYSKDFNRPNVIGFYGLNNPKYQTEDIEYRRIINDQYRDKPLVWTLIDKFDTSKVDEASNQRNNQESSNQIMQIDKVISYQISDSNMFNREDKKQLWLQDSQEFIKNELKNIKIISSGMLEDIRSKCLEICILGIMQHEARKEIARNIVNQMHRNVKEMHWCCLVGHQQISYNLFIDAKYFMDLEYCGYKVIIFIENWSTAGKLNLDQVRQHALLRDKIEAEILKEYNITKIEKEGRNIHQILDTMQKNLLD